MGTNPLQNTFHGLPNNPEATNLESVLSITRESYFLKLEPGPPGRGKEERRRGEMTSTTRPTACIMIASGICIGVAGTWLVLSKRSKKRSRRSRRDSERRDDEEDDLGVWISAKHHAPPCYDNPYDSTKLLDKAGILALRRRLFSSAQSVSYANRDPLLVVRGKGARLIDENGRSYLDTRNNVGHVGHSHPRVVAAVAAQAAAINTNTRYLHPNLVRLAAELLKRCPSPLERVFFVNSGSEANDLALRLARNYTRKQDIIVVEDAYHGHTGDVIDISPYKFAHVPGGTGRKPWVHVVPAPDTYRGLHRGSDAGEAYAKAVEDTVQAVNLRGNASSIGGEHVSAGLQPPPTPGVAAFFIESGMSVAGVVLPPPGYLERCFSAVRRGGGVCVADEVQVGFGRFGGSSFWGFQASSVDSDATDSAATVVPDIVTTGKPFGNGMPLAAVITTKAIADAFDNGLEYFNTFGGNPVCAAAGLAVLEILDAEDLPGRAATVGAFLMAELRRLAEHHGIIGDVRGRGMFIGVDFVRDRTSREPATAEVSVICSRLKEQHRILTSVDGPHDNVIVIKPPLAFTLANASTLITALDEVLLNLGAVDPTTKRTPT